MRVITNINDNWFFNKREEIPSSLPETWERVTLPHTWNNADGMDGGNDYYRGKCTYTRLINKKELPNEEEHYLEINGANSSSFVYLNGEKINEHHGGYSTFRTLLNLNDGYNLLSIVVDNSPSNSVYPQVADFTFYGGLYRDVNIISVPSSHFDTEYYGGPGIKATPFVDGRVEVEVYVKGSFDSIRYTILDREGNEVIIEESHDTTHTLTLSSPHLWNGKKDPYLYTLKASLLSGGIEKDRISVDIGFRSFVIDSERGFILNGEEYPLRGVSRHQDRWGKGNAITKEDHDEDMALILEMGANTVRLAHYQHDQYFYSLCDKFGLIVWAEIPYISQHLPSGRDNTISQMKELIVQNYNHPSIVVWGISNEITMNGADDSDMLSNHHILNNLCHAMDKTRLTTMAVLTTCKPEKEIVHITDVVSYNHYFGWYGGEIEDNAVWFDDFHKRFPDTPIGCSEYGCEALNWHSSKPEQGDYTEEYQAYYHEEMIKTFFSRPYIWATHAWNMFDFGADARGEGGENGQNHKGLVTIDRKYKKDSFYAYKAWLSEEKFVHICSKRYVDRVENPTLIKVYSNMPEVSLFVNGELLETKKADDHFFSFSVPNEGETIIKAKAGDLEDESRIRKVEVFNEEYRLKEKGAILNWFDITEKDGYCSLNTKINEIMKSTKARLVLIFFIMRKLKTMKKKSVKNSSDSASSMLKNKDTMKMIGSFTILRISSMAGTVGMKFTKEELLTLNKKLNKVKLK
ncbi:MAG: glycoside hydrolase family 2 TIM barrel-domain containing protein [Spirochaetales bacterium]|nr:glycoside hydrolase family 2 TIM barrel-domain containing protein [Spirochaetales bacterium]